MSEYSYGSDAGRGSSVMMGFVLGAIVGAGVALLLAPATGEETRGKVADAARRLRTKAGPMVDRARETMTDLRDDAMSAVESGREAFKQTAQRSEPMHTPGRTTTT